MFMRLPCPRNARVVFKCVALTKHSLLPPSLLTLARAMLMRISCPRNACAPVMWSSSAWHRHVSPHARAHSAYHFVSRCRQVASERFFSQVEAILKQMKCDAVDSEVTIHEFSIGYKMRASSTSRSGDFVILDPHDGERIRSMVRLRAKLDDAVNMKRWPVRARERVCSPTTKVRAVNTRKPITIELAPVHINGQQLSSVRAQCASSVAWANLSIAGPVSRARR